jgi:hypothetical protein
MLGESKRHQEGAGQLVGKEEECRRDKRDITVWKQAYQSLDEGAHEEPCVETEVVFNDL